MIIASLDGVEEITCSSFLKIVGLVHLELSGKATPKAMSM